MIVEFCKQGIAADARSGELLNRGGGNLGLEIFSPAGDAAVRGWVWVRVRGRVRVVGVLSA